MISYNVVVSAFFSFFLSGDTGDGPSIFCMQTVTELAPQSLASIFNGNLSLSFQRVDNLLSTVPHWHEPNLFPEIRAYRHLLSQSHLDTCLASDSDLCPISCSKCYYLPCALPLSLSSVPGSHSSLP